MLDLGTSSPKGPTEGGRFEDEIQHDGRYVYAHSVILVGESCCRALQCSCLLFGSQAWTTASPTDPTNSFSEVFRSHFLPLATRTLTS